MDSIFTLNLSGPQSVCWDLTNKCNFNCLHCFNRSGDKNCYEFENELSYEEIQNCIKQIIDIHPETVCLCGGEPTLNPFLIEILEKLNFAGIKVNMVSNGSNITPAYAKQLKKAGIRLVQISLDSHIEELHNRFRQHKNAFQMALNALRILKQEDIITAISMTPTKFNCRLMKEFLNFIEPLHVDKIRVMPLLPMGRGNDNFDKINPTTEDYFILKNSIFEAQKRDIDIEWGDPLEHIRKASEFNRTFPLGVDIKANGNIGFSAYLPIFVGNIKRHTLKEYWENGLDKIWGHKEVMDVINDIYTLEDLAQLSIGFWLEKRKEFDIIDDKNN